MRKLITLAFIAITAMVFTACLDETSSPSSPSYDYMQPSSSSVMQTPLSSSSTVVTKSTPQRTQPVVSQPTYTSTAYYDVVVGGVCQAMPMRITGTLTGSCQADATDSFISWCATCNIDAMHPAEYDNYTLQQIENILLTQLLFNPTLAASIIDQANRCGSAMYVYDATSGLNFLYIERVGDGKGLMKRH